MKIEELEPFVLKAGFEPKHLYLQKGGNVKWLVCDNNQPGQGTVIVFDGEGSAYESEQYPFEVIDYSKEELNVHYVDKWQNSVSVDGVICNRNNKYDYNPRWEYDENWKIVTPIKIEHFDD